MIKVFVISASSRLCATPTVAAYVCFVSNHKIMCAYRYTAVLPRLLILPSNDRVLLPDTPISQSALNLPSNGCLPRVCLLHSMTKRLTAWYRGFPTIMEHVRSKHVRGTWKENQPWVASVYSNSFWLVLSLPIIFAWAAWCDALYKKLRTRLT